MNRDKQIHIFTPEEKLPTDNEYLLAYCTLVGYEDLVNPEIAWYDRTSCCWFTKNGEQIACVKCWFEIPYFKISEI